MNFEFSPRTWAAAIVKASHVLLSAFSAVILLQILIAKITPYDEFFYYASAFPAGYQPVSMPQEFQDLDEKGVETLLYTAPSHEQGAATQVKSSFAIVKPRIRIFYEDLHECVQPDGEVSHSERQNGTSQLFNRPTFSGFPKGVVPDGFEEKHRRKDTGIWPLNWQVADIPPVGSWCRVIAHPYTKQVFDLVNVPHPTIYSNWFEVVE